MTSAQKLIRPKLGLLERATQLGNVSQAGKVMAYRRDTFYRCRRPSPDRGGGGPASNLPQTPLCKNHVPDAVERTVVAIACAHPTYGPLRAPNELHKLGVLIAAAGVRSVWLRHDLETFTKRLKALEASVAQEGSLLTESHLAALEQGQHQAEAHGEIATEHPGHLGAQDAYQVDAIKGVGRIYQQTFIDTYSRVATVKLYTEKTARTAADLLNNRLVPLIAEQGFPRLRLLTDRGAEYCGRSSSHAYQLDLALEDSDHTRTKGPSSADQRHLRALPPHHAGRVLWCALPQEALPQPGGVAGGCGRLGPALQ